MVRGEALRLRRRRCARRTERLHQESKRFLLEVEAAEESVVFGTVEQEKQQ